MPDSSLLILLGWIIAGVVYYFASHRQPGNGPLAELGRIAFWLFGAGLVFCVLCHGGGVGSLR
jgi:hypothetical protein